MVALSLKLFGFSHTQHFLLKASTLFNQKSQQRCDAQTITRLTSSAASLTPRKPRCLLRSLVCSHLMERRGLPHQLRLGFRKDSQGFHAHAWIEYQQAALCDSSSQNYTVLN
ncbi:MAG: lasso peptide biosynthesis B2 protein [Verrucomicrobiales bacterium]|nr:lasso peptide biosynthesis B2 protein [Verrucomicrobiales bacterium]